MAANRLRRWASKLGWIALAVFASGFILGVAVANDEEFWREVE